MIKLVLFILAMFTFSLSAQENPQPVSGIDWDEYKQMPDLDWGFDPFVKKPGFHKQSAEAAVEMKLDAIFHSDDESVAVINGEVRSVGAILEDGRRLKEIGRNFVVLEKGKSQIELTLPWFELREPSSGSGIEIEEIESEESND